MLHPVTQAAAKKHGVWMMWDGCGGLLFLSSSPVMVFVRSIFRAKNGIWKTSTDLPSFQFFPKAVYDSLISQPQLSFSQGDTQGLQQRQRHALMFGSRAHLLGTQHPTGGLLSQGPQGDRGRLGAALPMELPLINST